MNSEIMKLKRLAEAQGFVVDLTENSHLRWKPPQVGAVVISTRSPGGRDMANLIADLKRVGYRTEEEIKREQRRTKKINRLVDKDLSPALLKAAAENLSLSNTIGLVWGSTTDHDYEILSRGLATEIVDRGWYDLFVRGDFKDDPFTQLSATCIKCDKTFNTLFARFKHEEKCGADEVEKPGVEPTVDRLPCPVPECDRTFHKNNPTSRLNHMQEMHNITECPNCYKVMQPSSLDKHLSDACPVLKRGMVAPIKRTRVRMDATPPLPPTDPFLEDKVLDVTETKKTKPALIPAPIAIPPAPVVPPAAPVAVPVAPTPAVTLPTDDDTLWTLLEMVVDGPVILNRELMATTNEWMTITKKLREHVSQQRSS